MTKTNKTFKLDAATISSVQEMSNLLGVSQAEIIKLAMEKAFSDANFERDTLMKVYDAAGEGVIHLQAIRDNTDNGMSKDQTLLHDFLNEVWDKARRMPQFPEWA